jgi:hypothetical protein
MGVKMTVGPDLGKKVSSDLDDLVEVQYVPKKRVSKMVKQGWEVVGAAVGTPSSWSVLMIRSHLNNRIYDDDKRKQKLKD